MSSELNTLIRSVAGDHPRADMRELARFVAKMTPPESVTDFYTEALADRVRILLGNDRRDIFDGPDVRPEGKSSNRSPKVEQRRSWWADLLASRVHIGKTQWLQLGECGVDELTFCIEERRGQIIGFEKQITNFEHLIMLMVKHGVRKVADLPAQTSWPS
jgi:hypothetical protein